MNSPYFLTEDNAILLDTCARDIRAHAGLYLLCGARGVGKTCLLQVLARDRIDAVVRWIDLAADAVDDGDLVDSCESIEKIFAVAQPGDVIVADHFEMAMKKSRHQLFASWSTEGIDKQLSLVIGSNDDLLGELRQLAQHYQVRLEQFIMQPLRDDEVEAFLGAYLFPDRSPGPLSIPPVLRQQLAAARGDLNRIVEIAQHAGDQVGDPSRAAEAGREREKLAPPVKPVLMAASIAVIATCAALGWYLLQDRLEAEILTGSIARGQVASTGAATGAPARSNAGIVDTSASVEDNTTPGAVISVQTGPAPAGSSPGGVAGSEVTASEAVPGSPDPFISAEMTFDQSAEPAYEPVAANLSGSETMSANDAVVTITYYEDLADELPATEIESEPASADEIQLLPLAESVNEDERLHRDLQSSLAWIDNRDGATGTLQILLLSKARFDPAAYYDHVSGLERAGVDVSQLKIVATYTGGRETYSVLYGEYRDRQSAADARDRLAMSLREASPIARSVAGLREEIRRLADRN